MFTPDLMHEFELGVWRTILEHILRILDAENEAIKNEFDRRQVNYARLQTSLISSLDVVSCHLSGATLSAESIRIVPS